MLLAKKKAVVWDWVPLILVLELRKDAISKQKSNNTIIFNLTNNRHKDKNSKKKIKSRVRADKWPNRVKIACI